jgi:UDP-4-amino-4,6-dideoxy-L-N-acetyl-beta-L-altrosamine transaminase
MHLINYGKQSLDKSDFKNVKKVLKSDFLTQGPMVSKFETALKKKLNSKHCTVVSSGSAALHLLGIALGWKKKDIILTTPVSFVATSNCILYAGAKPIFIDIDENTGNICILSLQKKIKELENKKNKIKAIIAIDYGGCPSDWPKLKMIAKRKKITLINDGCHALGSAINNNINYAIKYADFVTYSFHPVKPITTGEGGAILTNNKKVDEKIKILRTHGIKKNIKKNIWFYDMKFLGFNYRITDFQCALGIGQLRKIEKFNTKRKKIASIYDKSFKNLKFLKTQNISKNFKSSYHLYPLRINFKKLKLKKNIFFKKMIKLGIKLQVHYIPIYRHTYYKKILKIKFSDFPNAEKFYNNVVSLPVYYDLTKKKQNYIIKSIKQIISNQSKNYLNE